MKRRLLIWMKGSLFVLALLAPAAMFAACETEEEPMEETADEMEEAADELEEGID